MSQKYYLAAEIKRQTMLVLILLMVLSVGVLVTLFFAGVLNTGAALAVLLFLALPLSLVILTMRRFRKPEIELTDSGLILCRSTYSYIFKTVTIKWDDFEGMAVTMMQMKSMVVGNSAWKMVKLILKSEAATTKEMYISLRGIERSDELLAELTRRIPALTSDDFRSLRVAQGYAEREMSYRNIKLTRIGITKSSGILRRKSVILWKNITSVAIQGQVIAGYGATTITYRGVSGTEEILAIPAGLSSRYIDVLRYIANNAISAFIDPGIVKALQYPPGDAIREMISIVLIVLSIIIFIPACFFMADYTEPEHKLVYFPLLIVGLVVPFVVAVYLLSARSRGRIVQSSIKVMWSIAAVLGPAAASAFLLLTSPYSWHYVRGDIAVKTGDLVTGDYHYMKALKIAPDSPDVIFSLGILYHKQQLYVKAFKFFEKAYKIESEDWGPPALVLIPDSLMHMGKYDEAIEWCDRILSDQKKNRPKYHGKRVDVIAVKIEQVIQGKRNEIIRVKSDRLNR